MKMRMYRRLWTMAAALLMAMGSLFAVPHHAAAAGSTETTNNQDLSEIIMRGLWAGINVDFDSITGMTNMRQSSGSSTRSTAPALSGRYAALGDSVAAGVGLNTPLSVPADQARCGRTAESYPVLVSQALAMQLTDVSCSGATAGDIITVQRDGNPNQPPQLDTAFASGTPALITITAGANDVHWRNFLFTCYYSNCATATGSAAASAYRAALHAKLYAVFTSIELRSGGRPPTVVYTGYYNPVSSACQGHIKGITNDEINWFMTQVSALNTTIQDVARNFSFVRFTPVDFSGHDICSAQPWVQGLSDPQPIHPTAAGQQVIAGNVLAALGR